MRAFPSDFLMPIIKSAIKRMRQNKVRNTRLQPYKTQLKTMMKKLTDLAKAGKKADAEKILPAVYKAIDTAAKKGFIHKKNASHKKSLMARMVAAK